MIITFGGRAVGKRGADEEPAEETALGTAFAALATGEDAEFSAGKFATWSIADFDWESLFHYSAARNEAYLMGQQHNQTFGNLATYSETAGTWTDEATQDTEGGSLGHILGNFTVDPATGDCYWYTDNDTVVRIFTRSTLAWDDATPTLLETPGTPPNGNGMAWHPNLYGSGDGGLVLMDRAGRVMLWRKSTNAWSVETSASNDSRGGIAFYVAATDKVFLGGGHEADGEFYMVDAGPTLTQLANPTTLGLPNPHANDQTAHCIMMEHPDGSGDILVLGKQGGGAGENRVWISSDNGTSYTLQTGVTHPFDDMGSSQGAYVACSLPRYGGVWGVNDNESWLWKPPSS